jgi:hypothetical protein
MKNKINIKQYGKIHHWIRYHYGSANKCENKKCQATDIKGYEWALIKGKKYEKNIKNFKQLCRSCHKLYDCTDDFRETMRKLNTNTNKKVCKFGHKLTNENTYSYKRKGINNNPTRTQRHCITCNTIRNRVYRKNKREALDTISSKLKELTDGK